MTDKTKTILTEKNMKTFEISIIAGEREYYHQVTAFGLREALEQATDIAADEYTDVVRVSVEEMEYMD